MKIPAIHRHSPVLCLFLVTVTLSVGSPLYAQTDNDFGTWTSLQVIKTWKNQDRGVSPYAQGRAELRSFENASAVESYFLTVGGGCAFNKYFRADLGYEFWKMPGHNNTTTHKGVVCLTGSISSGGLGFFLREKYEMAYTQELHTTAHTLRTRLRAQYSISSIRLTPYMMYELFGSLTGMGWLRSLHYAGAEFRFGKHNMVDLFYLYNLYPSVDGTCGRHIAGLGYYLVF